jgi:ELWxxDGT repeat protein
MVKDINLGVAGSIPTEHFVFGNNIYFSANDGNNGAELWISDGTLAGTMLVEDINPGAGSGSPGAFIALNGSTFCFRATDAGNGAELWRSDGTPFGTMLVKDINTGTVSSRPVGFCLLGNNIYFAANDGTDGIELWKTNGTPAGTSLVKDINAGASNSSPTGIVALGNNIYFQATAATNGSELWSSDGTLANTALFKDINPGAGNGAPQFLSVNSPYIYFSANDGTNGAEIWKSDGTLAGTAMMADINPGAGSSSPTNFCFLGTRLCFAANDGTSGVEPWSFCAIPGQPGPIAYSGTVCTGSVNIFSVAPVGGAASYTWTLPGGWTGGGSSNIISPVPALGTGSITVAAISACGTGSAQTLTVTVHAAPSISVSTSNATLCAGHIATLIASGANSYTWSPGGGMGVSDMVFPSVTTTYTVIGTGVNGCTASAQITQIVQTCAGLKTQSFTDITFSAYPNPAKDVLNLSVNAEKYSEIRIINMLGSVIYASGIDNNNPKINVAGIPAGIYFVKVQGSDASASLKIVKE